MLKFSAAIAAALLCSCAHVRTDYAIGEVKVAAVGETLVKASSWPSMVDQELIYNGMHDGQVKVLYRAVNSDGSRADTDQDLTYGLKPGIIRFRKLRIQVLGAGQEAITFKVVSDRASQAD